jgi:tetratricopeptide (TPR) repeat protein
MNDDDPKDEVKHEEEMTASSEETAPTQDTSDAPQESLEAESSPSDDVDTEEEGFEGEEEEVEFDLEAQIEEFRSQIEEEPENCVHHYNLGEALSELGDTEEAKAEFDLALEYDKEKEFASVIHFAIGEMHYNQLISGIHGTVVRSSVGLHSAHKVGDTITEVNSEDYEVPISEFELAIENLNLLKADDDIFEYINQNAPTHIADTCYKWASDLIDKSRQIEHYGDEIKDVKAAQKLLKKTLDIDPNHSQATLMVKYVKKMLLEGWQAYDEYGFEAKKIQGSG